MDLLTNAVDAIRVGVSDYQEGSWPRLLSAVRDIHAGILLLYKEALRRRSPAGSNEVLVKARMRPQTSLAGTIHFVGAGKKTASTHQIQERFKSLGIVTDWKRFHEIAEVRHDIEHYYPTANQQSLQGVVASAFAIIRSFTVNELKSEPQGLLGKETWEAMVAVAEVYDLERKECDDALALIDWESDALREGVPKIRCSACGSSLLRPADLTAAYSDVTLQCRICGQQHEPDNFVPRAVEEALSWESYVAMDDGDDAPFAECPECGTESYVMAEGRCALCGESATRECAVCGHGIPASEMSLSPLCSWCANQASKND